MNKHLAVYFGKDEPRDRESFLWIHKDEDGNYINQVYDGGWKSVSSEDVLSSIGDISELSTEDKSSLVAAINEIAEGGSQGGGMVSITYSELKALRDAGSLIPGQQYRITDYHCTTIQENTRSAGHQFDIIVTADSESVLNENARAIQHEEDGITCDVNSCKGRAGTVLYRCPDFDNSLDGEQAIYKYAWGTAADVEDGDYMNFIYSKEEVVIVGVEVYSKYDEITGEVTAINQNYFTDCNLAAWELKYSIDNDTARFAWADARHPNQIKFLSGDTIYTESAVYVDIFNNGEFVSKADIYIDEYSNMIGLEKYDSDEIVTVCEVIFEDGIYTVGEWRSNLEDVAELIPASIGGQGVIYYMKDEWNNECPYDFKNIQFKRKLTDGDYDPDSGTDTWVYTFTGMDEDNNYEVGDWSILSAVIVNDEGAHNYCHNNIIRVNYSGGESGYDFALNDIVFLNRYLNMDSAPTCYSNTFGNDCYFITFGTSCFSNTFGNQCFSNTFNDDCGLNTFSEACSNNTFDYSCQSNTFGNSCSSNTFGNDCYHNTFGNYCYHNTFGNSCKHKHLESTSSKTSGITGSTPEFWFNGEKKW